MKVLLGQGFTQIFGMLLTGRMKLGHATMQVPIHGQFPVVHVDCTGLLRNRWDLQVIQLEAAPSVQVRQFELQGSHYEFN